MQISKVKTQRYTRHDLLLSSRSVLKAIGQDQFQAQKDEFYPLLERATVADRRLQLGRVQFALAGSC